MQLSIDLSSRPCQAESHNGVAALARLLLDFGNQLFFQVIWIRDHLAPGYLLIARAVIAQFADGQPALFSRPYWRAKGSASHRARGIQITSACGGIKRGAGLVVGEFLKCCFSIFAFIQNAGLGIARESGRQSLYRLLSAPFNLRRPPGIARLQIMQSLLQPLRIQLADGEGPIAAL